MRQFGAENLILATLGGIVGFVLAVATVRLFDRISSLPRIASIGVDVYALFFAFCITVLTGLLVALAPSTSFSRVDLIASLKARRARSRKLWRAAFTFIAGFGNFSGGCAVRCRRIAPAKLPASRKS